jgi:Bacteriophage Sf6, terminase small subunit-like
MITMAGRPRLRALTAAVEADGGDTVLMDRIASGEAMRGIAASYSCSTGLLYDYLTRTDERKEAWYTARRIRGHVAAEEAGDVLTDLLTHEGPLDRGHVGAAREVSAYRRWLAAKLNREDYGDSPTTVIGIQASGDLHLQALQRAGDSSLNPDRSGRTRVIEPSAPAIATPIDDEEDSVPQSDTA